MIALCEEGNKGDSAFEEMDILISVGYNFVKGLSGLIGAVGVGCEEDHESLIEGVVVHFLEIEMK